MGGIQPRALEPPLPLASSDDFYTPNPRRSLISNQLKIWFATRKSQCPPELTLTAPPSNQQTPTLLLLVFGSHGPPPPRFLYTVPPTICIPYLYRSTPIKRKVCSMPMEDLLRTPSPNTNHKLTSTKDRRRLATSVCPLSLQELRGS